MATRYVFIKLQNEVFLLLPPDNRYEYLFYRVFIHLLCWSHTIYVFYIIYKQCQIDLFLLDWEKSRGDALPEVSMWRTIMIANEFNKLQFTRKNSIEINLVIFAFFVRNTPPTQDDNIVMDFANICLLWLLVSLAQHIFRFLIYDRYCSEPLGQRFIDLATLAKVSIFILDERYHGYYLHCRSPYEFAGKVGTLI